MHAPSVSKSTRFAVHFSLESIRPPTSLTSMPESSQKLYVMAQSLCRKIAPVDLIDAPEYIVPQSQLSASFGPANGCYGYTAPTSTSILRTILATVGTAVIDTSPEGNSVRRPRPAVSRASEAKKNH